MMIQKYCTRKVNKNKQINPEVLQGGASGEQASHQQQLAEESGQGQQTIRHVFADDHQLASPFTVTPCVI